MKRYTKTVTITCLFFFLCMMLAPPVAWAKKNNTNGETLLLLCTGVGCKYPRRGREDKSTHIAFPIKKGQSLLYEVKSLRTIVKEKGNLQKRKLDLKDNEIRLYKIQLTQAGKTAKAQGKHIADLTKSNKALTGENHKLTQQVAKYRGERYKFMIIGFGIGAGVVLALGITTAVVVATR